MYVKVFDSILRSSIWAEDSDTRIVWLTMLVLANRDGFVAGSPTGLARFANVPIATCRKALKVLETPDLETSTQDYAGRRIETVEGGWQVLNYLKYRDLRDEETRRAQLRDRVQRHRAKKRAVTVGNATKPHTEAEAEAEEDTRPTVSAPPAPGGTNPSRISWKAEAAAILRQAGVLEAEIGDAIATFWAAARARFTDPEITLAISAQGQHFKARGESWNPARVWNPHNADFDERFRWAISQARRRELATTRQSRGLGTVAKTLQDAAAREAT